MMKLRHFVYFMIVPIVIGVFNVLVNPLDQWHIPRLPGINDKITETGWDPIIKSYQVAHADYDTLILGSSRAAIALSPTHAALQSHSAYNYGLSGAGIYLQQLALQRALSVQPIKHIIITPDFFGFNAHLKLNQPLAHGHAELEKLFVGGTGWQALSTLSWSLDNTYANTLGWRGTNAALRTLIAQNQKTVYIDRRGYWNRFGAKEKSYVALYDRTEKVFLTELLFPSPLRQFSFEDKTTGYNSFDVYRQLLTLAHERGIEVHMIILPTPARDLLALQILGLWPQYVYWKQNLVSINESLAAELQVDAFPLWDFENVHRAIESDHLPEQQPFFYEPFHPTPMVGDQILNRIFLDCQITPCWPGAQIDTKTVDLSLATLDAELQYWRARHPLQVAALLRNIDKTRRYRQNTNRP